MKARLISFTKIHKSLAHLGNNYNVGIIKSQKSYKIAKIETGIGENPRIGTIGYLETKEVAGRKENIFSTRLSNKKVHKIALITGGTKGIGKEIAIKLASSGFIIVINSRNNDIETKKVLKALKNISPYSSYIKADVSKEKEVKNMFQMIAKKYKRLDVLVNNAGITNDVLFENMSIEDWDLVIDNNLKSVFLCTKESITLLKKSNAGKVINMSSVIGQIGNIGQSNYSASKSAINGLTKTLAKELAKYNILVNSVAPGFIETDMTKKIKANEVNNIISKIPLNRFGDPRAVASLIDYLASDDNTYITGAVIDINGGLY